MQLINLKALALNCTLKPSPSPSSTEQQALEAAAAAASHDDDALYKLAIAVESLAHGLQLQSTADVIADGSYDPESDRYIISGDEGEAGSPLS